MPLTKLLYKWSPLIAFVIGIWYFCLRILGYDFEYIPGDLGDSRFINFLLEHGHRWVSGELPDFWDGQFMYPFKNTIALSDGMLGTLPIYSLFRLLNFSPETAYQLWWLCVCCLNYWISYLVFKKWFGRNDVAVVLAYVFAFSIFNLGQLGYTQMSIRFMVPVVFYAAHKMVVSPALSYLSMYCCALVVQFYSVAYTGFYLLYFSILFMLILCFLNKSWSDLRYYFKKEKLIYTVLIFFVSGITLLWYLLPYQNMSDTVGLRLYREVLVNLPLWHSYLFPHNSSLTWRFLFDLTKPEVKEWWLHMLFTGIIPFTVIILSPLYLVYARYKKIQISVLLKSLIITSIVITLLHLRTENGWSFYALIFKLPGIKSMRVLTRFMNVELFILLLLFGYFLTKIQTKYLPLFFLLVVTDNLFLPERTPREKKEELIKRKEVVIKEIQKYDLTKIKAVAYVNTTQPIYVTHLDAMLATQNLGLKTVNGYSSYCPDDFRDFFLQGTEEGVLKWAVLNKLRTEEILLLKN